MTRTRIGHPWIGLFLLITSVGAHAQFADPPLPTPVPIATDPFNDNSQVGYCLTTAGGTGCTANDFSITFLEIVDVIDGCFAPDDYMQVDVIVNFQKSTPTRYDVGAWFYRGAELPTDFNATGQDAITGGFCTRFGIEAGLGTSDGAGGFGLPLTQDLDGDLCIDVPGAAGPIEPQLVERIVLPCRDVEPVGAPDGLVDVSACTSWTNNSETIASCGGTAGAPTGGAVYEVLGDYPTWANAPYPNEIRPGTSSKCNCGEFPREGDPGIRVNIPNLSVTKTCTPTNLAPGETTTCTVQIINSGNGPATGATGPDTEGFFFEDNFPESQGSVVGTSSASFNGSDETIAVTQGSAQTGFISDAAGADTTDESLNIYPGDIPAGTTVTVTYDFQTSPGLPSTLTTITNTVCGSFYSVNAPDPDEVLSYDFYDSMCAEAQVTTPVTLARFEAVRNRSTGLMELSWATAAESGNLGFNLYAKLGRTQFKINPELIPSEVTDSMTTTHYRYSFDPYKFGPVTEFYIEDVDILGRPTRHGPFSLGSHGQSQEQLAVNPTAWNEINDHVETRSRTLERQQILARQAVGKSAMGVQTAGGNTKASRNTGEWSIDISVSHAGIQRVPFQALSELGVPAGISASEYAIVQGGASVPVYFGNLGRSDSVEAESYLEFVGEVSPTLYSNRSHYTLHVSTGVVGQAMNETTARPRGRDITDIYVETSVRGEDTGYSPTSPVADNPWYDARILGLSRRPGQSTYTIELSDVADSAMSATITARYWGGLDFPEDGDDHYVEWRVDGRPVLVDQFDGIASRERQIPVVLNPGASEISVSAHVPGNTPRGVDLIYVDEVELNYPRYTRAIENQLGFRSDATNLAVSNLTGEVVIYAKSATETVRLKNFKQRLGRVEFTNVLGGEVQFWVAGSEQVNIPQLTLVPEMDIRNISAADLVITHDVFMGNTLDSYAHQRSDNTAVVPVSAVYAAYSDGNVSPDAIQAFIRDVANRRGGTLNSVLLVGGDTYDYYDNLGLGSISYIPTFYRSTDNLVNFSAVDAIYGDLDADAIPEVAVGRLPVRTVSELSAVLTKQQQFSVRNTRHAVLAADYSEPGSAYNFGDNSEFLGEILQGAGWTIDRTYLDELPPATANAQLVSQLNAGPKLAVFTGHSGKKSWSFDGLFTAYDAAGLTNENEPFAVLQWGCWNTYFVEPSEDSLGHMFLLNGNRGAAAVIGASTLTNADRENAFSQMFQDALLAPNATLGSAMTTAKAQYAARYGRTDKDILWGISLLGDPLLSL